MADDYHVEIRGIRELSKAFGRMDPDLRRELKNRFRGIAEAVARRARGKVDRRSGRAASSIKGRGSNQGAAVAFGGSRAPYLPWLDFGGSTGRGHRPGVYWSGSIKREWKGVPVGEGRYVYPAISEERGDTQRVAEEAVRLVAQRAGFEVR